MINFINKKIIIYILITLLIFTLDRISKIYVINIAEIDRVTSDLDPSNLITTSDNDDVSVPILE